jgi:diacylglycerol O-acyltransferase
VAPDSRLARRTSSSATAWRTSVLRGPMRALSAEAGAGRSRSSPAARAARRSVPAIRDAVALEDVRRARREAAATVNDVCLAIVAGGLRELALAGGEEPRPLKAMVPVNVRGADEAGALGNRISFAFVELPLDLPSGRARLARVQRATGASKRAGRAAGREAVLGALGMLPDPLRGAAARAVASPRLYNLTISNVPGPPFPLYMLGAELLDAHPVVPIADGHALSIGIFGYRGRLHFGLYADPHAFPQVRELPAALDRSLRELLLPPGIPKPRGRPHGRPLASAARERSAH